MMRAFRSFFPRLSVTVLRQKRFVNMYFFFFTLLEMEAFEIAEFFFFFDGLFFNLKEAVRGSVQGKFTIAETL